MRADSLCSIGLKRQQQQQERPRPEQQAKGGGVEKDQDEEEEEEGRQTIERNTKGLNSSSYSAPSEPSEQQANKCLKQLLSEVAPEKEETKTNTERTEGNCGGSSAGSLNGGGITSTSASTSIEGPLTDWPYCDIGKGFCSSASGCASHINTSDNDNNNNNNNNNNNSTRTPQRSRYIDSRSILTNKERLKKFWERRMELEFKLRQQEMNGLRNSATAANANAAANATAKQQRKGDQLALPRDTQKHVNFDSNNNNHNRPDNNNVRDTKTTHDKSNPNWPAQRSSLMGYQVNETESAPSGGDSSVDFSPTGKQHNVSGSSSAGNNVRQVSAELVCEKLRQYQQASGKGVPSSIGGDTSSASIGSSGHESAGNSSDEVQLMSIDPTLCHSVSDQPMIEQQEQRHSASQAPHKSTTFAGQGQWAPSETAGDGSAGCESYTEREEQTVNEEFSSSNSSFGPMSLSVAAPQPTANNSSTVAAGRASAAGAPGISCTPSAVPQASNRAPPAGELPSASGAHQTPGADLLMSNNNVPWDAVGEFVADVAESFDDDDDDDDDDELMRTKRPELFGKQRDDNNYNNNDVEENEDDEDEEPNSAQSGSVLTVITKLDHNHNNVAPPGSPASTARGKDEISDPLSSSSISQQHQSHPSTIGITFGSMSDDGSDSNTNNEDETTADNDYDPNGGEVEDSSNIGVAFESLHFDSEIKSSKQERVDEQELLITPIPVKRGPSSVVSKFNAEEVKSVCNFITAAISDATRQVESYMGNKSKNNNNNSTTKQLPNGDSTIGHQVAQAAATQVVSDSLSSIQRATFVQESTDSSSSSSLNNSNFNQRHHELTSSSQGGSGGGSCSATVASGKVKQRVAQVAAFLRPQQPIGTGTSESSSSPLASQNELAPVEFISNNDTETDNDDDSHVVLASKVHGDDEGGDGDDERTRESEVPSADLSSIFEANVRREIEKFETNSAAKKSQALGAGKLSNKNALTEWRIAEEIRLFNEREMELKRRFEDTNGRAANSLSNGGDSPGNWPRSMNKAQNQQKELEAVVRFGKTLQIPKASASSEQPSLTSGKCIKLTSSGLSAGQATSSGQPATTMISMHKFIASGGKRFVFTNGGQPGGAHLAGSNGNNNLQQSHQFAKSMSNLSSTQGYNNNKNSKHSGLSSPQQAARTVDYKAVDSLKCKETPNVKPGLTKKVIETFSRLSSSYHNTSRSNEPLASANGIRHLQAITTASTTIGQQQSPHQNQQQLSANLSAEWKIQEELREMRAREAELRDQRNQLGGGAAAAAAVAAGSQAHMPAAQLATDSAPCNGLQRQQGDHGPEANVCGDDGLAAFGLSSDKPQVKVGDQGPGGIAFTGAPPPQQQQADHRQLSFSSESLYPIRQAIDSFRKLNSTSHHSPVTNPLVPLSQQNSVTKIQRKLLSGSKNHDNNQLQAQQEKEQQQCDDYESKVGGQRRKISMIERWESKTAH